MNETLPINLTETSQSEEEKKLLIEFENELDMMQECMKQPSEAVMARIYKEIHLLTKQHILSN